MKEDHISMLRQLVLSDEDIDLRSELWRSAILVAPRHSVSNEVEPRSPSTALH